MPSASPSPTPPPTTAFNPASVGINIAPLPTSNDQSKLLGGLEPNYLAPTQQVVAHPSAGGTFTDAAGLHTETMIGTPVNPGAPYANGFEWSPLQDPSSIPKLQAELVDAGLLDPKKVRVGAWDTTAASALATAAGIANRTGATLDDTLKYLIQNQKLGGASSKPGPYPLTNPVDTKAAFQTAAQKIIGHDLPKSDADKFAAYYQQQERNAYSQEGSAVTSGGLTYQQQPTGTAAPEDYINAHYHDQAMSFGMASRMLEFQNLLGTVGSR